MLVKNFAVVERVFDEVPIGNENPTLIQFQHGLNENGVVMLNNSSLLLMVEAHLKYGIESLDGQSIRYLGRIITSLKCVLTQEHFDTICAKDFVPEEVSFPICQPDATYHERKQLAKIGIGWHKPVITFEQRYLSPAFEYEDGDGGCLFCPEQMDLNAFIRTADPLKVRVVERARAENERPIVTVAKHRTMTLLPTTVARSSGELSATVEKEFAGDASIGDGESGI
ncbi:hypothetical protein Tco_1504218 [Tanacetum coccineum]